MDTELRENKAVPSDKRASYRFERLTKRGQSLFFATADARRTGQAARMWADSHPEIGKAGDRFRTFKEEEGDVKGVGVYRVAIDK